MVHKVYLERQDLNPVRR